MRDPKALVLFLEILKKTEAGKLAWQPTAEPDIFLWPASRTGLQVMDQPFPPRPALFLNLVVMSKPFRFGQLFANLWVTHSHTKPL